MLLKASKLVKCDGLEVVLIEKSKISARVTSFPF